MNDIEIAMVMVICGLLGLVVLPPIITCTPLCLVYLAGWVYVFINAVENGVARKPRRKPQNKKPKQVYRSPASSLRNEEYFKSLRKRNK